MNVLTAAHMHHLRGEAAHLVPFCRDTWPRSALAELWAQFDRAGVLRLACLDPAVPDGQRGDLVHFVTLMRDAVLFLVFRPGAAVVCGLVWATALVPGLHACLGCAFLRDARGSVAAEAVRRAGEVLADVYALRHLYLRTVSRRAKRFAETCGATVVGCLPAYTTHRGRLRDLWLLAVPCADRRGDADTGS